ncbi:MAG: helix-turn-helix transcriptional regulator [Bdellovibrionales bacterium]|nr:helix-turn-helix transcriptional regulator [Bdellovibrionales bacterium]
MKKSDFGRAKINVQVTPGEMLKTLRELQEMTQLDLSKLTSIPQSNISAMENGSAQIGRDRALALAKALKVHPAVILFPDFDIQEVA